MAIKSKGIRPFIVKMPNEPSPMSKYGEKHIFEYRGGKSSDPHNYSNFMGENIVDYVLKDSYGRKDEIKDHTFRSKETMINWLLRNGYAARDIPEGVYVDWDNGNTDSRRNEAEKETRDYLLWKQGKVYGVASMEDPSVTETVGDPIYLDDPRDLPEGAKFSTRMNGKDPRIFYGKGADDFVKGVRANMEWKGNRRYKFKGEIRDLTPEQAQRLGLLDSDDIRIGDSVYVSSYILDHPGPGNVRGDIYRTKNTRPGTDVLPRIGEIVRTPRFLEVDISEVFPTWKDMWNAGYTEPTHYDGAFEVFGKVTGRYTMEFAASPKRR